MKSENSRNIIITVVTKKSRHVSTQCHCLPSIDRLVRFSTLPVALHRSQGAELIEPRVFDNPIASRIGNTVYKIGTAKVSIFGFLKLKREHHFYVISIFFIFFYKEVSDEKLRV